MKRALRIYRVPKVKRTRHFLLAKLINSSKSGGPRGFRTQGIEWRCKKIHKVLNTKSKKLIFSKNIYGTTLMLVSYSLFNLEAIPPLPDSISCNNSYLTQF